MHSSADGSFVMEHRGQTLSVVCVVVDSACGGLDKGLLSCGRGMRDGDGF